MIKKILIVLVTLISIAVMVHQEMRIRLLEDYAISQQQFDIALVTILSK